MMHSANRRAGLVIGGLLAVLGIAGLIASIGVPLADTEGVALVAALTVNPLQGILTLATGAALIVPATRSLDASRRVNGVVGTLLLAAGIGGLYLIGTEFNVLAITSTNSLIQFAVSAVLLVAALGADRPAREDPAAH